MTLLRFIAWRLAENARARRQSLPRRYVNVSGVSVTMDGTVVRRSLNHNEAAE